MLPTSGGAPILGPAKMKSVTKKIGGKKGDKKNKVVADKENQPPDPEFDVDLMPPPAVMRSLPAGRGRRIGTTTSSGDNSDEDNEKDRDLARYFSEDFGSTVRVVPVGRRRDQKGSKEKRIAAKSSEGKSAENAFARKRKATPESESGYDGGFVKAWKKEREDWFPCHCQGQGGGQPQERCWPSHDRGLQDVQALPASKVYWQNQIRVQQMQCRTSPCVLCFVPQLMK